MIYTLANTIEIGRRMKVFVDGNEVPGVVYADTDIGLIRYMPKPYRVAPGTDYVYTEEMRGVVTVKEIR